MSKKCRRCSEVKNSSEFGQHGYICSTCKKKAEQDYFEKKQTAKSASVRMYADDVVRQFLGGSGTALMCACRDLAKHYERNGISVKRSGHKEV